ncbi:hypothetical protein V7S43_015421 [Phytophthora oleae]|uniref:Uncharacterized protein n=1 Tax=Phytophthora oleae TaxID=2107226 RepID=A0ABD3EZ40_9STRA
MVKPLSSSRAARNARRVIEELNKTVDAAPRRKRQRKQESPDETEMKEATGRLACHDETRKRNAEGQLRPPSQRKRRAKAKSGGDQEGDASRNVDAKAFFCC